MVIIKLMGGLGNQMFQYAMGRQVAKQNNIELKLDTSSFKIINNNTPRHYSLNVFNIKENFINQYGIKKIAKHSNLINKIISKIYYLRQKFSLIKIKINQNYITEKAFNFDPEILKLKDDIYLDGYWQSEKYFKDIEDIIRKEFTLKNVFSEEAEKIAEEITAVNSVSLHIRRGDYINNEKTQKYHGSCSLNYYYQAVKKISRKINNPVFFIFSDDIEWVKNNLKLKYPIKFVSGYNIKNYEELILMSKCKHNIIANSSFSWWGAWLNNNLNKIVVAPKKWFNDLSININNLIPESWTKI
ncbi:MAG: alpha-1,2-fucosyltransferase [Patescibacteria group bacterium]